MKLRTPRFFLAILALSLAAFAVDVSGKWTAQVPGRQGQTRETTFTFKADGDKLTGTMTGMQGEQPISDGKISGSTITFVRESQRGKQTFTGTIAGDEIKFKRAMEQGEPQEFVAKRVK
jgi:hypothetical protein